MFGAKKTKDGGGSMMGIPAIITCELNNSNKNFYCLEMWKIGKMLSGELFIPWVERVLKNDPVASKRRCWVNCGYYQDFRQRYENKLQFKNTLKRKYVGMKGKG